MQFVTKIWDKEEELTLPNGQTYTAKEIMRHPSFPFASNKVVLIEQYGNTTIRVEDFERIVTGYNLENLSTEEAIIEISLRREESRKPMEEQTEEE